MSPKSGSSAIVHMSKRSHVISLRFEELAVTVGTVQVAV